MKRKIALYCGVNKIQQTKIQQLRLLQYAIERKQPFDYFKEEEASPNPIIKAQLMKKLSAGDYSCLVIYNLNCWAGSLSEFALDIKELLDTDIGFISLLDNLDFSTKSNSLHFKLVTTLCRFERANSNEKSSNTRL